MQLDDGPPGVSGGEPPPEDRLEAIVHTAVEVGVRIQMSGGYTARVRESADHVARALGADRAECTVSSVSIGVTAHLGSHSHTALRRTPRVGVNFAELSELSRLVRSVEGMSLEQVRDRLDLIESRRRRYPTAVTVAMLGVACACLSVLFGADAAGALLAGAAGMAGAGLREVLLRRDVPLFVAVFFAALLSATAVLLTEGVTATPTPVLAAAVLYLVPGVPLLNGTADLLTGAYLNGVVRLTMGLVVLLAITLGVTVSLGLWGLV